MSQALYRKWRPQDWEAVIGQDHIVQTLRNAIASGRVAHAYLFAGPRGTGKTTTARLLAKAVNCLNEDAAKHPCNQCDHCRAVNQGRFLDLIEIDAASNTSVEDVRELRDKINFTPNLGRYKIYIVDEVHMLSTAAFNALLKTLEEPPPHAIFILATTEVHKIPATVLSRCQRHEFRRIPVANILSVLGKIAQEEGIQAEAEALTLIARQSTGAMRDAISLLDQLASTGQVITLELAQTVLGTATSQSVLDVVEALLDDQPSTGLDQMHQALDRGSDPRQFARQMVDYLRSLLLIRMEKPEQVDASPEVRVVMARHAQHFSTPALLDVIRLFNQAANELRSAWQPALPLEMAFIQSLEVLFSGKESAPAGPPPSSKRQQTTEASKAAPAETAPARQPPVKGAAEEASPASEEFKHIEANWHKVLTAVRKYNPGTQGKLNSCSLHSLDNDVLTLAFRTENVRRMMKDDDLAITRKALLDALGQDLQVICIVAAGRSNPIPQEVDNDGMVATALRDLGGEIVDIQ